MAIPRSILKWAAALLAILGLAAVLGRGAVAELLLERGRQARARWSLAEAASSLRLACLLGSSAEPCLELVRCLLWRGDVRAARSFLDALAPRVHPGSLGDGILADLAGVVDYSSNEFASAIARHRRAGEIAAMHGDAALAARSAINEARALYYFRARYERARTLLEEALARSRDAGDAELEADALRNLAVVRWFRGEWDGALHDFSAVLEHYRRLGHRRGEAITLSNLSLVYYQQGDFPRFHDHQMASVSIKKEIGDLAGLGESYAYLGALHVDMGNLAKAHDAFERSLELSRRLGYHLGRREAEARLVWIKARLRRHDEAIPLAEALLASAPKEPAMILNRLESLAGLHLQQGNTERAREYAGKSLELEGLAEQPGWQSFAYLIMALSFVRDGDPEAATVWIDKLTELPLADQGTLFPWGVRYCRAEVARLRGRRAEALAHYLEAVDVESRLYGASGSGLLVGQLNGLYEGFFDLLFSEPPSPLEARMAFDVLERLRYRSLRNRVVRVAGAARAAELRAAEPPSLPVRGEADPGTALVFYVLAHDRTAALVLSHQRFEALELQVGRRALEVKVKLFRAALGDARLDGVFSSVAADLHRRLIAPLEASGALDGIDRLGILPFGILHDLPFAGLLRGGEGQRFLVEDYVLFHPPSAAFLTSTYRERRRSAAGSTAAFGFNGGDLRFAEDEARAVAALLGGRSWTGGAATEAELFARAAGARTLHVAAHAVSEPLMPMLSRLLLAPGGGGDGRLTVSEILGVALEVDLVTLGACRSAQSHSPRGDDGDIDRLGLIEAFLYAGASSVVASLLPVDDRATLAFMERFYGHLARLDKAAALAEAQRAALRGGEASHPRFWAPFVLIGEDH